MADTANDTDKLHECTVEQCCRVCVYQNCNDQYTYPQPFDFVEVYFFDKGMWKI